MNSEKIVHVDVDELKAPEPIKKGWRCMADRSADPPQDCCWPACGCDPYANQIMAEFEESGLLLINRTALDRVFQLALTQTMQMPPRSPNIKDQTQRALDACRLALGETER